MVWMISTENSNFPLELVQHVEKAVLSSRKNAQDIKDIKKLTTIKVEMLPFNDHWL